jgi:hypothetical protein
VGGTEAAKREFTDRHQFVRAISGELAGGQDHAPDLAG